MYQDPYSRFGEITSEAWRAIRLVVDTGIHSLGWSRQQALDYCRANAAKTEREITTEVDRYIAIPAQALAYKVGELKIRQLRSLAEKELGPRFDLRAFHDQLLARGALPLDVLEAEIKNWLAERKSAAPAGSPASRSPSGMLVAQ
jgi:prolyl oligopeptidase